MGDWSQALRLEKCLREKIKKIGEDGPKAERNSACQKWFEQVSHVLELWIVKTREGNTEFSSPIELMVVLRKLTDELGVGIVPQLISDVAKRGRTPKGISERKHIGLASAYFHAVKDGIIEDRTAVKTVKIAYGVRRETAQKWKGVPIPKEIKTDMAPENLKKRMLEAGKKYKQMGRGLTLK